MTASALLIISAAFHALWNLWLKRSHHKLQAALAIMIVATLLNTLVGAFTAPLPLYSATLLFGIIGAGLCEGVYFYLLNTAYAHQTLGVAYTIMRGGAMILVWLISTVTLGESITQADLALIGGILVGIALTQRSFRAKDLINSGAYAAYACAACIAGYHIAYGVAVQTGAAPAFVFAAAMTCGVLIYVACCRSLGFNEFFSAIQAECKLIALAGIACGLSFLLFITALTMVEPGRAISLRNTSVAFGAILSFCTGERLKPAQWLGIALVCLCVIGLL